MFRAALRVSLGFVIGSTLLFTSSVNAESADWLTSNLETKLVKELSSDSERPPSFSSRGNRDCIQQKFITRPSRPTQSEKSELTCATNTSFGTTNGRLLKLNGTNIAGSVQLPINSNGTIVGTLQGQTAVLLDPSALYGSDVSLVYRAREKIKTSVNVDGSVSYSLRDELPVYLKNKYRQPLSVGFETYSFSENGRWMLADSPYVGHVRVDLENGSVFTFGAPMPYGNGIDPQVATAISADGRYALVNSVSRNYGKLYDLSDCTMSDSGGNISGCKSRDVRSLLNQKLGGTFAYGIFRFVNQNKLSFYASGIFDGSSAPKSRKYTLSISGHDKAQYDYLGLGDSFASGEGADNYKVGTDTDDNTCHLSLDSFPYLLGRELQLNTYESISCSGAVIEDIISSSEIYDGQTLTRIFQRDRDEAVIYSHFTPGELSQIHFKNEYSPKNISISIAGNNIGFGKKLLACVLYPQDNATCFNTYEERKEVFKEIASQIDQLRDTYTKLKENDTTVYVIAYPKIIKAGGSCGLNVRLNESETYFADALTETLNNAIEVAAKQAGVVFVDTEDALVNHRLCEASDDDIAVHGLTEGDDRGFLGFKFLSAGSYHPNKLGQKLYKDAILAKTNNFTAQNPQPAPAVSLSEPSDDSNFYDVSRVNRDIYLSRFVGLNLGEVQKSDNLNINIDGFMNGLKPSSSFRVELHSSPVQLGSVQTDPLGNIRSEIALPPDVEPGYHSLHLFGETVAGEPIDLYDYFYISNSLNDSDRNKPTRSQGGCVYTTAANVDFDGDGIDDACDGDIGKRFVAPVQPEVESPIPSGPSGVVEPTPDIITPVNNSDSAQDSQPAGSLQPQSSNAQNAPNNLQTGGSLSQTTNNTNDLLSQGSRQSSLTVLSSPFATSGTTSTGVESNIPPQNSASSGGINAGIVLVGVIVLISAGIFVYKRYLFYRI